MQHLSGYLRVFVGGEPRDTYPLSLLQVGRWVTETPAETLSGFASYTGISKGIRGYVDF